MVKKEKEINENAVRNAKRGGGGGKIKEKKCLQKKG
jgi:hypothetical protein